MPKSKIWLVTSSWGRENDEAVEIENSSAPINRLHHTCNCGVSLEKQEITENYT